MLRILPYILLWMSGWLIYFPSADLNPLTESLSQGNEAVHFVLPSNYSAELTSSFNLSNPHIWIAWSPNGFMILQTLWKPLFLGSGILLLLLAVIFHFRNKKLEAANEQNVLMKMSELEQTALRAQMNPHFIFNALNSIQSFIVDGDKKSSAIYLAKFSKLVRTTLNYSDAKKITLSNDIRLLENYIELEKLRFEGSFDFKIIIDPILDVEKVMVPPMLVQPFVENAILHGLAPKQGKGLLTIHYQQDSNGLLVMIADNGIGLTASKKLKKERRPGHRSLGMNVSKKRLALMNGSINESQLIVNELVDEAGNVAGTEVKLLIKKQL